MSPDFGVNVKAISHRILLGDAAFWADSMPMNFSSFTKGKPADPSEMMDSPSRFIPPALYPNFYLSFYRGYCDVLRGIYLLLETEGVLSAERVLPFIPMESSSQFYFQKGGRIEYAFDSITRCAEEQSPLGDDTFAETFEDDEGWVALPTCANDLEFKLVRRMLGLDIPVGMPGGQRWGPYDSDMFGDDGMDLDEDDDSDSE